MKSLLDETRGMAETNKELKERLEQASEQTDQLREQLKEREEDLFVDGLTDLYNRKAFDCKIEELIEKFKKEGDFFSLLFLDIDNFKNFNDTYGHDIGDLVLKSVGHILQQGLKGFDFPARYGGEEFVILLPGTELANARIVAEQLRIKISVRRLKEKNDDDRNFGRITASLGVAGIQRGEGAEALVKRADNALYLAKDSGRNSVKTENDLGAP